MPALPFLPCREFVAFLDEYLAGALTGERRDRFDEHLSRCPPCVVYMQTYLLTPTLARTAEPVPATVPEELVRAILAARTIG
jgi:predicted anti-sigma-YlaC factor YlaD